MRVPGTLLCVKSTDALNGIHKIEYTKDHMFSFSSLSRPLLGLGCAALLLAPHTSFAAEPTGPIFHMRDGSFYHPSTGLKASSKAQLEQLLNPALPPTRIDAPLPIAKSSQQNTLREATVRGQALLSERIEQGLELSRAVTKKEVDTLTWPVTLAIWHPETNTFTLRALLRRNKTLTELSGAPVSDIEVTRVNGVNSEYVLTDSAKGVVVANTARILKVQTANTYLLQPVVYTPYSAALHTTSMVNWGKDYLDTVVDNVYQKLEANQVRSLEFPNRLITDVIDKEVVKTIAIIEHADVAVMQRNPIRTVEAFFVTIAGNDTDTYAYSRSSAGALGLVQFIPSTYHVVVKKRPELQLISDFEVGMRTPENAIKAQIGYLDMLITEIPEVTAETFATHRARVNEYLAASYNGGSGRVRRAIDDWDNTIQGGQQRTLANLDNQRKSLASQITTTKKEVAAAKTTSVKKTLTANLKKMQIQHAAVTSQVVWYQKFALRTETRGYVIKYRQALASLSHIGGTVEMAAITKE